ISRSTSRASTALTATPPERDVTAASGPVGAVASSPDISMHPPELSPGSLQTHGVPTRHPPQHMRPILVWSYPKWGTCLQTRSGGIVLFRHFLSCTHRDRIPRHLCLY